jgi:hypothetical protein
MHSRTLSRLLACLIGFAALSVFGMSQPTPQNQQMDFESKIGAMRFFNCDGKIKLSFKGTVLIRNYKGSLTTTGNLRKEYNEHGRSVFFGDGSITLDGHWESMQWFGRDMVGSWFGRGGFRLYGDYDRNMETGFWWVDGVEKDKLPWPTQSSNYVLPYTKSYRGAIKPLTVKPKGK